MNYISKSKIIIFILFISVIIFFTSCGSFDNNIPKAEQGILDLTGWDFKNKGYIKLNGEWGFYYKKLLTPDDIDRYDNAKEFIEVPDSWHKLKNKSGLAYGTYRLKIKLKDKEQKLSLYFHYIYTAYKIFVNDKEFISCGKVGDKKKLSKPDFIVLNESFINNSNDVNIIIQVSNFHHRKGGILSPILFGFEKNIRKIREFNIAIDILIFSSNFFICIYFLFIFFMRKKEYAFLFFFFMCLSISVKILLINEIFIKSILPDINWIIILKSEYILNILFSIFFNMFIYSLYSAIYPKVIRNIFNITAIISIFSIIVFSSVIISRLVILYYSIFFIFSSYSIYILVKMIAKKTIEAVFFFIGFTVLFITALNDILYNYQVIQTNDLSIIGLFVFVFFLGLLFSSRFTKAFNTAEYLTDNLKKEVDIKTKDLQIAKENQKDFFIKIAHETKTPLTLIKNYLDIYIEEVKYNPKLHLIKQNIDKLTNNIINFLDTEKLQEGIDIYNYEEIINLSKFIHDKVTLYKEIIEKNELHIYTDIDKDIYIKANTIAIDRVINNLLDNAAKYNKKNGTIKVDLFKENETININISDTGIGIAKDKLDKVFLPYYQVNNNKYYSDGIGMGLYIVKNIIDSLQGNIIINSEQDKGTCINIKLKEYILNSKDTINNADPSKPLESFYIFKDINTMPYDQNKNTIFIVEDNIDMINFLKLELEGMYNFYYALDGKDALNKIDTIPKPDLIISDIMMKNMDGFQLIKNLTEDEKYSDIPIIFLTAKTTKEDKIEGLHAGAVSYIYKPFSIVELKAEINALINKKNILLNKLKNNIFNAIYYDNYNYSNQEKNRAQVAKICTENNIKGREKDVLALLIKGKTYKDISNELFISIHTVKSHSQKIYKKLKINNRNELINLFNN